MDLDANIQKLLRTILKKWKIVVVFALIGAMLAVIYTANFTTLTYSSSIKFLTSADDTQQELSDSTTAAQTASNTSKMNYAIKMLATYIELFRTNEFNQTVADILNREHGTNLSAAQVKASTEIATIENTAMFNVVVTTTDPELSYRIARQLEASIPEKMENTNNGLVTASVEDKAIKATEYESKGYIRKGLIGTAAGIILAVIYIILRDLLDVRIKSSEELGSKYDIPVLGTIPEFEFKATRHTEKKSGNIKGA